MNNSNLFLNSHSGALYIRVSTDKQEELSPDAQKRLLLDYAQKHQITVKPEYIFIEKGISGRNAKKRPEFQRMISLAKSDPSPFQTILLWKFSRFARNQEESIVYKSMLRRQCGVNVISITEPIMDGPFGSLIERIIEWMDEYYSINLSGETLRGMTEKAMRGGYQSTPPLGYRAAGNGLPFLIVEREATIVSYIFNQYSNNCKSPTAIAKQLNEMGVHTKRGGTFDKRNITYILRNSFYIGQLNWNGISSPGQHKTFISNDTFQKAQKLLDAACTSPKHRSISTCRHWLSGLVRCSVCGASLSYNGCRYPYFSCWKYSKGYHKEICSISEKKLIQGIMEYLNILFRGESFQFSFYSANAVRNVSDILKTTDISNEIKGAFIRSVIEKIIYDRESDTLIFYLHNE